MIMASFRVLIEPIVGPVRHAIASGYMYARRVLAVLRVVGVPRKSNPRCEIGIDGLIEFSDKPISKIQPVVTK